MSKKSSLYRKGGSLLILSAVLPLFQSMIMYLGRISLSELLKSYMQSITIMSKIQLIITISIGVVLIAKAFFGDMIPDIVLVGLFGVLALLEGVAFLKSVPLLFRGGDIIEALLSVTMNFLMVLAYGSMAAIIFMKDSFGGFFFVPAAAVGARALLIFLLYGLASLRSIGFLFEIMLVGALFSIGPAVKEE